MARAVAKTGTGPTAMVALEQGFPKDNRILTDDLAYSVLPLGTRVFLCLLRPQWARNWLVRRSEKTSPGSYGAILCRKRYIDEKLLESLDRVDAVVNLGAGFDTRMYRLGALARMRVWETDLPENIQSKRIGLRRVFGAVPGHVTLAAIDFDHEELGAALAAHGFSAAVRTFYIWEAVTQYLTEHAVRATFDFLAKAAKGSRLVFSYIRKDFLDGRVLYGQEYLYKRYVVKAGAWHFGMDPEAVTSFLASYGWHAVENVQYAELAERYVKPRGRKLLSTPIERIVYAEKP
jgi:methyltransferase (TIGR00027 family)